MASGNPVEQVAPSGGTITTPTIASPTITGTATLATTALAGNTLSGDATLVTVDNDGATLNATSNVSVVYSNEGASGLCTFTLPTAVANLRYGFFVHSTNGIKVAANTGDTIQLGGTVSASAGDATSTTAGSYLEVLAVNATKWVATTIVGTWSVT